MVPISSYCKSEGLTRTLESLRKQGYKLIGLTMDGENLNKMKAENKVIYVFGSESHGVRPELEKLVDKSDKK